MNTAIVQALVGQRCWYVSAGGVTWPSFVLVCGEMIARDMPLRNQVHPDTFRNYRGSVELLVWCSWRLQTDAAVLASSRDDEPCARTLDQLVGATVSRASCSSPAWDLELAFSNGLTIEVFADSHGPDASPSRNWELWVPGTCVQAGPGEAWEEEPMRDDRSGDRR
jgi:hypothetical protein